MYTLVFDTETTGLPIRGAAPDLAKQPWVIQLAAILYRDSDQWPVGHMSTYLIPEHGEHKGSFGTDKFFHDNKLTGEFVLPSAMPTDLGIRIFNQFLSRANRLVAHNMAFDQGRMRDTYRRLTGNLHSSFENIPKICTMETLTDVMKLPGRFPGKFKWPNLAECYKEFVDPAGFADAHDAMNDVSACAKVLFAVEAKGIPLYQA